MSMKPLEVAAVLSGVERGGAPAMQPGAGLAHFMALRGRKVVEACGALWHSVESGCLLSLPYQARLDPAPAALRRMLLAHQAPAARFPSSTWPGLESGVYLYRKKQYGLQAVQQKERSRVRQGLRRFEIRPARADELMEQGMELNRDTMRRQGRYDPEFGEPRRFLRFVEAAFQAPGVRVFAAFDGPRMAAYLVTCRDTGCLYLLAQMSRVSDLKASPNCALTFEVTRYGAEHPELNAVCYGSVSLLPASGLHLYKLKFGYEVVPHQAVVRLHPGIGWILKSRAAASLLGVARRFRPENQTLQRVEMTVRAARIFHGPSQPQP